MLSSGSEDENWELARQLALFEDSDCDIEEDCSIFRPYSSDDNVAAQGPGAGRGELEGEGGEEADDHQHQEHHRLDVAVDVGQFELSPAHGATQCAQSQSVSQSVSTVSQSISQYSQRNRASLDFSRGWNLCCWLSCVLDF
eukprot:1188420-Prorocentrum_minimum.AAC.4